MNSNKAPNTPKIVPKTSHTCMCHVVVVIRLVPRILEMVQSRGPPFIYLASIYTTTMKFQKELDSKLKKILSSRQRPRQPPNVHIWNDIPTLQQHGLVNKTNGSIIIKKD